MDFAEIFKLGDFKLDDYKLGDVHPFGLVLAFAAMISIPSVLQAVFARGPQRTKLAIILGLGVTGFITYKTLKEMGMVLFVWHVLGMALAIFALQPCALHMILCRKSETDAAKRTKRVKAHKNLQIAAFVAATVGFLAVFLNKPAGFPGKHFTSVHGLVGLCGLLLMVINHLQAAIMQGNPIKPKMMWVSSVHRSLGSLTFVVCIIAASLGLYNRTVVVDWEATPLNFSLPDEYMKFEGWGTKNLGYQQTVWTISIVLFLLPNMLFPGEPAKKAVKKKGQDAIVGEPETKKKETKKDR